MIRWKACPRATTKIPSLAPTGLLGPRSFCALSELWPWSVLLPGSPEHSEWSDTGQRREERTYSQPDARPRRPLCRPGEPHCPGLNGPRPQPFGGSEAQWVRGPGEVRGEGPDARGCRDRPLGVSGEPALCRPGPAFPLLVTAPPPRPLAPGGGRGVSRLASARPPRPSDCDPVSRPPSSPGFTRRERKTETPSRECHSAGAVAPAPHGKL